MIYKELTELHQIMCHRFYELAKKNPKIHAIEIPECKEIMDDIKDLERIAEKYFNAKITDYWFETQDEASQGINER